MAPPVSRAFPPEAASVPAARRFVRGLLVDAGQEQWVDEAQLAVSELSTNAVLHAQTPFEVTVQAGSDGVYVQVWDDDPAPPARRVSDDSSTTGRGLELVEAVATFYGVQVVGPTKVVWFCLGMPRPDAAEDVLLDRWRDRSDEVPGQPGPARDVVLAGMPAQLWIAAREHHNTLLREYSLHEQAATDARGPIPATVKAADRARSLVLAALRAAEDRGPVLDLRLRVLPEQAAWFEALRDVLDHAEWLAASGSLLAPPGPRAIVDVRRWACRQVLQQLDGDPPEPWDGPVELPAAPG